MSPIMTENALVSAQFFAQTWIIKRKLKATTGANLPKLLEEIKNKNKNKNKIKKIKTVNKKK